MDGAGLNVGKARGGAETHLLRSVSFFILYTRILSKLYYRDKSFVQPVTLRRGGDGRVGDGRRGRGWERPGFFDLCLSNWTDPNPAGEGAAGAVGLQIVL